MKNKEIANEKNYKISVDLWLENENKLIETLELNVKFLQNEIKLKQDILDISLKTLEHEKKFLEEYLKNQ